MPQFNREMMRVPRTYARWLWVLAGLFLVRVVAQPLAARTDIPLLPPFEAWHSGVVPYGVLVRVQGLILVALFFVAWTMSRARVRPPTVFPLVLAGFLLVCGRFHVRYGAR